MKMNRYDLFAFRAYLVLERLVFSATSTMVSTIRATAFTRATSITRTFPLGAARTFAFTTFWYSFLNGKCSILRVLN